MRLAVLSAWVLVAVLGLVVVLMAVFRDDVVGAWADHHEGAREVFDQGGRVALERAGFAPPNFLPVAVTMLAVGAMILWVLGLFLQLGYRWGQLGLTALMAGCVYASVALGFVLSPPPVFVVVAAVCLLIEGVTLVCLWHRDTLAHVRGPWIAGIASDDAVRPGAESAGSAGSAEGPATHSA